MHLNSKLHRIPIVPCLGKPICDKTFISLSDMILHIENGVCTSGLNRSTIRKFAIQADRNNVITNPARLIRYSGDEEPRRYATEQSRNQNGDYQCVLCPRTFLSLKSLNAHYASSVHEASVFRCPNHSAGCRKEFRTLSAVVQHIEDGQCGALRSQYVKDRMGDLMKNMSNLRIAY